MKNLEAKKNFQFEGLKHIQKMYSEIIYLHERLGIEKGIDIAYSGVSTINSIIDKIKKELDVQNDR